MLRSSITDLRHHPSLKAGPLSQPLQPKVIRVFFTRGQLSSPPAPESAVTGRWGGRYEHTDHPCPQPDTLSVSAAGRSQAEPVHGDRRDVPGHACTPTSTAVSVNICTPVSFAIPTNVFTPSLRGHLHTREHCNTHCNTLERRTPRSSPVVTAQPEPDLTQHPGFLRLPNPPSAPLPPPQGEGHREPSATTAPHTHPQPHARGLVHSTTWPPNLVCLHSSSPPREGLRARSSPAPNRLSVALPVPRELC